ncbi:MAG TPA: response regulator [Myxococcota bacterium]|jgi:CheY-like chemotaxis protein
MDERRIGDLLVDAGLITRDKLEEVLARAGTGAQKRVLSLLYSMGLAKERALAELLAQRVGAPVAVLSESVIDLSIVKRLAPEIIRRHRILPVSETDDVVTVVAADPEAPSLPLPLGTATGKRVVPLIGIEDILEKTIDSVLAAVAAGERVWVGPSATGRKPEVAVARYAPPMAVAEANAIAKEIIAALSPQEPKGPRSTPIGAVQLKQVSIEKQKLLPVVHGKNIDTDVEPLALVVDDDDEIRKMLAKALEHDGVTVVQARDGEEAVAILRILRPDVVLLDAMLPKVHGFAICAALKKSALRDIPVIMISAVYRGLEPAREIQEVHGADHFVEKPFEITFVRKLVAELLRRPHVKQQRPEQLQERIAEARKSYEEHAAHGLFMAADADVQTWISLDPFDGSAWLERGNLCTVQGDLVNAMNAYEAAVVYDASLLIAHLGLATAYEQLGFQRRARATWQRARDAAPDDRTRATIDRKLAAWR